MSRYAVVFKPVDWGSEVKGPCGQLPAINASVASSLEQAMAEAQSALDAGLTQEVTLYVQIRVMQARS